MVRSRYFHFYEIIKRPKISFQSPALNQKHAGNVCHTAHWHLTKFHFDSTFQKKKTSV